MDVKYRSNIIYRLHFLSFGYVYGILNGYRPAGTHSASLNKKEAVMAACI